MPNRKLALSRGSVTRPFAVYAGPINETVGAKGAATWLSSLGQTPPATTRWFVEIALGTGARRPITDFDAATDTRFHINVYSEEWGVFVCAQGLSSWIRVTDAAIVHGRDDFSLLTIVPPLRDIGKLLRRMENQLAVAFEREHAAIRTNLAAAEPAVRSWVSAL